jgi:hypothetical protein
MNTHLPFSKGRFNSYRVNFGFSVSGDTITSQVHEQADHTSPLIFEWAVDMADAATGYVTLSANKKGVMDIRRLSGGSAIKAHQGVIIVDLEATPTEPIP